MVTDLAAKAKEAEAAGQKAVVEIKVDAPANANAVEIEIPRDAFNKVSDTTKADVKVDTGLGTIVFDANAVESISGAANNGDISISMAKVENSTLAKEIQEIVGDRPVYDFSVKAGANEITDFAKEISKSVFRTHLSREKRTMPS